MEGCGKDVVDCLWFVFQVVLQFLIESGVLEDKIDVVLVGFGFVKLVFGIFVIDIYIKVVVLVQCCVVGVLMVEGVCLIEDCFVQCVLDVDVLVVFVLGFLCGCGGLMYVV